MAKPDQCLGPDGLTYTVKRNREIDDLIVSAFGRGNGREALAYLRSITIENIGGPAIGQGELLHREGQRFLVGVIETRLRAGLKRRKTSVGSE